MRRKLIAASFVLLVLAGGAWARPATALGPEQQMTAFVADLRQRGEPVTLADMDPPTPAPGDNGAADSDRALDRLQVRCGEELQATGNPCHATVVGERSDVLPAGVRC